MQIITTAVIKGGTGKTTTAAAIAQAAAKDKKRVLAIDLDPQSNLSYTIGADQNAPGAFQLLDGTPAAGLIQKTPQGIDAITASPDLATVTTRAGSAKRLQEALKAVSGLYDLVVIDTPPTMGELTFNALQASTGLLIPLEADIYGIQGLYQIADIAAQMKRSNPALQIAGVILTRFDSRPKLKRVLIDRVKEAAADCNAPYLGTIRSGIAIQEAQALQKSLYEYAPGSKPAADYMNIYKAIKEDK